MVVEELGHGREVVVRHRRLMAPLLVVGRPRGRRREEHGLGSVTVEGAAETAVCAGSFNFRVVHHVTLIVVFMFYHSNLLAGIRLIRELEVSALTKLVNVVLERRGRVERGTCASNAARGASLQDRVSSRLRSTAK